MKDFQESRLICRADRATGRIERYGPASDAVTRSFGHNNEKPLSGRVKKQARARLPRVLIAPG